MPTVLRKNGFRFFFYSNEGNPTEPIHIHVLKGNGEAKIWLEPEINIANAYGFNPSELRSILKIVNENQQSFVDAWHEYFSN